MVVALEGCLVHTLEHSVVVTDLRPGDLYLAQSITGWKLLTCMEVNYSTCQFIHGDRPCPQNGTHPSYIIAKEPLAYSFDAWKAFKVVSIEDLSQLEMFDPDGRPIDWTEDIDFD